MKHHPHLLATLLSSLTLTTALTAATLPQIKPVPSKAPAALRIVKIPPAAQAPKAPKVPTLVKAPVIPKVAAVLRPGPSPKAALPMASCGPKPSSIMKPHLIASPKIAPAKVPPVAAAPKVASGTSLNPQRLNQLKQKIQIDPSKLTQTGGAGSRFLSGTTGTAPATQRPGSLLGTLKEGAAKHDRNPLSNDPTAGMRGDRNSLVSDAGKGGTDASKPSRNHDFTTTVKNKDGSESTHYTDGTELRFYPNGTAVYVDEKGKEHVLPGMSVAAPFVPNKPLTSPSGGSTKTPTPEGESSSGSAVITRDTLRGIQAKKNQASEPAQDETSGTGGSLNAGATGTGRHGSLSQPVQDAAGKETVTLGTALETLRVKVESRINNGR
jgi:hypothetical protein